MIKSINFNEAVIILSYYNICAEAIGKVEARSVIKSMYVSDLQDARRAAFVVNIDFSWSIEKQAATIMQAWIGLPRP